jgi:hypothetical protein
LGGLCCPLSFWLQGGAMADQPQSANRVETIALTMVFTVVTGGLLLLLPFQTRSGPESAGWWTQPWTLPAILLVTLFLANALSLLKDIAAFRKLAATQDEVEEAKSEIWGWLRPVEYFAYFLCYLYSLAYLGYFLSTALFIQWLLYRSRLRSNGWRIAGLLAALVLTIVFRWVLGIWVPTAELYDLFPDVVRKFLTRWF